MLLDTDSIDDTTENEGFREWDGSLIDAKGKTVVVIGGGDTGTDCIGTAVSQLYLVLSFCLFVMY